MKLGGPDIRWAKYWGGPTVCFALFSPNIGGARAPPGHAMTPALLLCPFAAQLRQQVSALSSQMSRGSGLSKDGLGDLKRVVEAVEAAGIKNGSTPSSASKTSAGKFAQEIWSYIQNCFL